MELFGIVYGIVSEPHWQSRKKKEIGKQKRRLTIASARRWCRMIYIQRPTFILKCVIQGFRDAPLALPFENAILDCQCGHWPVASLFITVTISKSSLRVWSLRLIHPGHFEPSSFGV